MFFGLFKSAKATEPKQPQRFQPRIELLEDRTVPSTVKISPAVGLDGWALAASSTAQASFVSGPATPPLGAGSVQLAVGSDGNGAAQIRSNAYVGTDLADLTALSYSTYVQQDGSGGQAPYIILNLDLDGNGTTDDLLFFEPVYQTSSFFPSNPQPALALNAWQTWDALEGGWWSLNGIAGATPGTGVKSIADYLVAEPDAQLANGASLRLVAGFGAGAWDNFVGNVDNVTVGVNGSDTTYDFETAAIYQFGTTTLAVDQATGQFTFTYTEGSVTHTITGTGARYQNGKLKIHAIGVDQTGKSVKIDVDAPESGPITVSLRGKDKKDFSGLVLQL